MGTVSSFRIFIHIRIYFNGARERHSLRHQKKLRMNRCSQCQTVATCQSCTLLRDLNVDFCMTMDQTYLQWQRLWFCIREVRVLNSGQIQAL